MSNDNVFTLHQGEKKSELPSYPYVVEDIDGLVFSEEGFLVFTSQHVAVMRDTGETGAIPVLVVPLNRVRYAAIDEEVDEEDPIF